LYAGTYRATLLLILKSLSNEKTAETPLNLRNDETRNKCCAFELSQ